MKIIGLDVGEKRIGVAKVDSDTKIAIPVGFIEVDGSEWQEIEKIARLNATSWFVLGLPRSNEGNETKQTLFVRNFAKNLVEKIPDAKIRFEDESLTSVEAETRLKARKKRYQKGDIDAEAAAIILQDFIEHYKNGSAVNSSGETGVNPSTLSQKLAETPAANLAKKEADKMVLTTKKAKHKTKKMLAWLTIPPILVILALVIVAVALKIRDDRIREREEYFASLEAEMEPEVFSFTIKPGETIFDIKANLLEIGYPAAEIDAAFSQSYDFPFLAGRPENASLEGYLYGETVEFYQSATVSEIVTTYLSLMDKVIRENDLENAYNNQGLSLYEGITLASVVQKEADDSPDQPTVAQVFLLRRNLGWRLGSDVTVSYALDLIDPNREIYTDNAAALTVDSCYNTRLYAGLPCGPISNPGLSALLAVAHPSDTSYRFFLTGDDGVMYYSNTESEHNLNAARYCQTLCNISL